MTTQLDKIIRINIKNEQVTVFTTRSRNNFSNTSCIRLINALISKMTDVQIN